MKNLVPKRRFEEFKDSDPWEQRKLGELAQYRRGSFPQPYGKEEWYNGDGAMPFVQVVDVTDSLALAENTKQKISRIAQPKSIFVPKGKVIVTLQGSIGRIAITQYDCFVDRTLLIFESYNRAIDVVFWAYTMQMKFDIEKEKAPGGTIKTITKEALTDFVISLPKYKEQQRIGTFLSNLDNLITLHQRKLDKLKETKSAYLSEMFPKEGELYPKRRFAGFTDPWEQRKLGELTNIKTGSSDLQDAVDNGEYPFFVRSENVERSNRYIFDGEAILIPGEGRLGDIYHYINGKFDYHQRVYKISDFADSNTDGKFVLYYLQQNFKRHALKFTVKATVDSLRLPMLVDFEIKLPNIDEQREVGVFFSNLDNLITLHQRKLDKLQALKQAYLSEMFV